MSTSIHPINKILVANRGEIAIRIFRAASELNIRTVAIFTYEDRFSLHRYKADEAYMIGEKDDPLAPYLDYDGIIDLAKRVEADAIHPGYGFLSENVHFVKACEKEGIRFVGPRSESMANLGDKIAAKKLANKANVPTIPGVEIQADKWEEAVEAAERIGFPIMVKAASGGGGRGMRVVQSKEELQKTVKEASAEAQSAFGDKTVFLEKFLVHPRHIEVQILGDHHGNLVHLLERDCSVQRRFQKVVEIAPASRLSEVAKSRMHDFALQLAEEVNYVNAGTVEFLVDKEENIYFIEVNPRLQVEHTVTEEITAVDIVRSQILVAMGHKLHEKPINIPQQKDIRANGISMQCRITTENPEDNFRPDYGTIIAYRSASGFGIRLDAGSAFAGAKISPFFDSLLVKVTARGRTMEEVAARLDRALREFRVRGVNTNIGFLLNLLRHPDFLQLNTHVQFVEQHPELLQLPRRKDRGTRLLRYLGDTIVNGNPDLPKNTPIPKIREAKVPSFPRDKNFPKGSRDALLEKGRSQFISDLKKKDKVGFTDTTFRDAHQSLIATRMRTYDLLKVAKSYAYHHGSDLFSIEMWGGATFDVCMRFLLEDPWMRLAELRKAMPNVLFQMLIRASNAVGYSAYPDNLVMKFIDQAAEEGIDVFRVFDSLNWVEAMKPSIQHIDKNTNSIAEAAICYSGDFASPDEKKFTLEYYTDLAKRLEDVGAHMIAIKDMAGLLKPYAAEELIPALKEAVDLPIHLHTHDTASIQSATYLKAIEAKVDVIDVANSAFSGLTSQPNFNSIVAMLKNSSHPCEINLPSLNAFSVYWEAIREIYSPFETELKAGTAEVYEHEIPGGQYSNLRPQARGLGLEDQFEKIKANYKSVNDLLGGLVKVTPSSKVVGDTAMFMTSNNLTVKDILEKGESLSFPDSLKSLMRGDLGQTPGGFPSNIQKVVLKDEKPYSDRPNSFLEPIDFEREMIDLKSQYGPYVNERDLTSYLLYPRVFDDFHNAFDRYGDVSVIPSKQFFYGMEPNEQILVDLDKGKTLLIQYISKSATDEKGICKVYFSLNGQNRAIEVSDKSVESSVVSRKKVSEENHVGAPIPGKLSSILVEEGDEIEKNAPLYTIEAMKMESTISAPYGGKVGKVYVDENTVVETDDLILELDPSD